MRFMTFALQRELDGVRTQLAAAEREHAAAAKEAEEASTARQAVTAQTDRLTKQRDDVMVVRLAGRSAAGRCQCLRRVLGYTDAASAL